MLFSVISGDYFYIAYETETLALILQLSQHLRLSSQYNSKVIFSSRLQTKNIQKRVVSLIPALHILFLASSGAHVQPECSASPASFRSAILQCQDSVGLIFNQSKQPSFFKWPFAFFHILRKLLSES